ncbi:MAG: hypothetical protein R3F40_09955 [Candidatus Competibacteraceae bacterium]
MRNAASISPQVIQENIWIAAAQKQRRNFDPPMITKWLGSRHLIERGANLFRSTSNRFIIATNTNPISAMLQPEYLARP